MHTVTYFSQWARVLIVKAESRLLGLDQPHCSNLPSLSWHSVVTIGPLFSGCAVQNCTPWHYGSFKETTFQLHNQNNGTHWVENATNTWFLSQFLTGQIWSVLSKVRAELERPVYELVYILVPGRLQARDSKPGSHTEMHSPTTLQPHRVRHRLILSLCHYILSSLNLRLKLAALHITCLLCPELAEV